MRELKFFIAGVQHHNLHRIIKELEEGEELILTPEPDNKFDPNAIRIEYDSLGKGGIDDVVMCGYVPRKFSAEISALLETDVPLICTITKLNKSGKPWEWCEVEIEAIVGEDGDFPEYKDDDNSS